jgi:hypothetical protein
MKSKTEPALLFRFRFLNHRDDVVRLICGQQTLTQRLVTQQPANAGEDGEVFGDGRRDDQ